MPNAFVRKLRRFADLDDEAVGRLVRLTSRAEPRGRGSDLVRQGERPLAMQLLLSGWACRYKSLASGRRQIVGFLLPGDICDLHVTLLRRMDHSIGLLTDACVVAVTAAEEQELERHASIRTALTCSTLVDEAILREWLTTVGQRGALARVGHLVCEIWYRLKAVGQVDERERFAFPLTQDVLGDTLGLTPVHVNRMLRRLRDERLIELERKQLRLPDPARLVATCGFDPAYLHLDQKRRLTSGMSSAG
ncbi:Crp/Fnr family transcriptional regulator [Sphingosinicella terrae]|jgi:CRP-like cAMP-binding protein|uniref:Crp/Fnr family transcriptional regulator n=1 Tax=Sphingosinicella terrae TaxID=2172047 RepID=UPI000E0D5040|nr:Crp/Fnr family transcriptional regulator [Sphingosinicella terrae]